MELTKILATSLKNDMILNNLIGKGYFPKELPPPFDTTDFGNDISSILQNWTTIFEINTNVSNPLFVLVQNPGETGKQYKDRKKRHREGFISKYNASRSSIFSISKGKFSRRFLQIPNPKHFALLGEKLMGRWNDFENVFSLSEYSKSFPIIETANDKRSISTSSKSVADFRNSLLEVSFDKLIEIRVDISKFYPTIYTHSIAWALLGKNKAKHYFEQKDNLHSLIASGDTDALLYRDAEAIDIALRACQERQSIGIPIGPDTSHIIAEAISCRIDSMLKAKFSSIDLKACRYFDDYYLYVSSRDEADKVLKGLQIILTEFQLEINEGKIKVREFPFGFEDEFTSNLHSFDFKQTNQSNSLKHYFSLIWSFAERNPTRTDWIFKYALRIFEFSTITIQKTNWKLFEDLIIKTALIQPAILDILTRIFLTYTLYLDAVTKEKLRKLVNAIIKVHCPIYHNFEVAWALWIAKTFEIEIDEQSANDIIATRDNVSNLILLDLANNTSLVQGTPNFGDLAINLRDKVLMSENWLIAYEAVKKGWIVPLEIDLLENNLFFKILKDKNIEFYKPNKQLTLFGTTPNQARENEPETSPDEALNEFISNLTNNNSEHNEEDQIPFDIYISGLDL